MLHRQSSILDFPAGGLAKNMSSMATTLTNAKIVKATA
jgi:hypothetical protein